MKERVLVMRGSQKVPVIFVAPHGSDDTWTDELAIHACASINAHGIINRGFERSDKVDVEKDLANCNSVSHCMQEVVYEEFLKPLVKLQDKLLSLHKRVYMFYIHGCGNIVHKEAQDEVGIIIGYGLGLKKHSLTCDLWEKNLLVALFNSAKMNAYEGKGGGKYAGRDSDNLNQYNRKHSIIPAISSFQLEYPLSQRIEPSLRGLQLGMIIQKFITFDNYAGTHKEKFI